MFTARSTTTFETTPSTRPTSSTTSPVSAKRRCGTTSSAAHSADRSASRAYTSGRNRTFFFVTYEGTRIRTSRTSQLSVPTPEQRGGDFSSLGSRNNQPIFDPATTRPNPTGAGAIRDPFAGNLVPASRVTPFAKQVLDFYPLPTSSPARGNNFFSTLGNISDNNQFVSRIDQVLGSKTTLSFRYYFFDGLSTNRSAIRNDGETNDVRTQNMALNVTHNFSARTLYELRLGYNRPRYGILQVGSGGVNYAPIFGIKNLLTDPIAWGIPYVSASNFSSMGLVADPTRSSRTVTSLSIT